MDQQVTVSLARDARMHNQLYPTAELFADLRGRIVRKTKRSARVIFFTLRDVSETIQIVVEREVLDDDTWGQFQSLTPGDGVRINGRIAAAQSGRLSVFPTSHPEFLRPLSVADLLADESSGVGTQILLARLENKCRSSFAATGFVELAARYLSNSWPVGGLSALQVMFPGQSRVPLYLAVSPNPQVLRALLASGHERLFTISRSFTTNIIADQNGAESVIACGHLLDENYEVASTLALKVVRDLIADFETALDDDIRGSWLQEPLVSRGSELASTAESSQLYIHFCNPTQPIEGPGGFLVQEMFRIQWGDRLVLAEGYRSQLAEDLSDMSITVHLERFLPLLRTTDNRRIGDLSKHTSPTVAT